MEVGASLQIASIGSIVWPKMPAYLRVSKDRKGVRLEWEEARNAQDLSGIQMDLEKKDWWQ